MFSVDPTDSDVLYTMALYDGVVEGFFYQSTTGGVDWTQIVTTGALATAAATILPAWQGTRRIPTTSSHGFIRTAEARRSTRGGRRRWQLGCLAEGNAERQ